MTRAKYIVLEGDEGAGKTVQLPLLQQALAKRGIASEIVREPGGDPFAEELRQILKHAGYPIPPLVEVLAFSAARASMLHNAVRPLLETGTWVLADRSYVSTLVIQGVGHGLDSPAFRQVVGYAAQGAEPDLTVIIDISLGESHRRQSARNLTPDRFDFSEEFRRKVNAGYRKFEAPGKNVVHIDGQGTIAQVHNRISKLVSTLLTTP